MGLNTTAQQGHECILQLLLHHGASLVQKNVYGKQLFSKASLNGHQNIIHMLLEGGADANCTNACGNSALHYVVFYGREETVQTLQPLH
jgi:ankyrin repeat protein